MLITIREYHCTGPPSFYTLAVLISLIIRVLLIIPQACVLCGTLAQKSIVRKLKKVKEEDFTFKDLIPGPTGCNAHALPSQLRCRDSITLGPQRIYLYCARQIQCFINLLVQTRRLLLLKRRASDSSVAVSTVQCLFQIQVGLD